VLGYATPPPYQEVIGIYRDGNVLIVPKDGRFPMRCIKCNAPAAPKFTWRTTLFWHPRALYLLILFPGLLIYLLVAFFVRKGSDVEVGLCDLHGRDRRKRVWIGWLIALAGMAFLVGAIFFWADPDYKQYRFVWPVSCSTGALLILCSLLWAVFATRVVFPKKIDNQYAWLLGAGNEFLDSVPAVGQSSD
jgi:hypothetical protein